MCGIPPTTANVGVLGSATAQQVIRKNSEAWRSFFAAKEDGEDTAPPGYWGNEDDGRELRTYIRNDQYTLETGGRSRLEIPVGQDLKEKYGLGYHERLRLKVSGDPKWEGEQGRLELYYDEVDDTFRAIQPVTVPDSRRDSPLAEESAALDVGANNLVACTTTTGQQYLYEGRDLFVHFRETTEEIARLQSKLREDRYSSRRIQCLYRKRTRRRDHAQDALVRDLIERLYDEGVATVYVGDPTDVLSEHWSARVNEKTHQFWAYRSFIDRLATTAEEYGITVEVRSVHDGGVSGVWRARQYRTGRQRVPVFVWIRGARRSRRVADVPRTTGWRIRSRVDGTARAPQVGRPQLVGATTLSREGKSQRGAHKPEYRRRETCLRGYGIANIPIGGIPPL